jgi:hypothetical protein
MRDAESVDAPGYGSLAPESHGIYVGPAKLRSEPERGRRIYGS